MRCSNIASIEWEVLQKTAGPFVWLLWLPPIFQAEEYLGIVRQGKFTSLAFDKQKDGAHIVSSLLAVPGLSENSH